jgi:ribonuclease HI
MSVARGRTEMTGRKMVYEVYIDGSGVWMDENGKLQEPLYGFLITKKAIYMEPDSAVNNPYPPIIVQATNKTTNNQAEYLALKELIEWLPDESIVKVFSDSTLVVAQIGGIIRGQFTKWECKHPELKVLKASIEARIKEKQLSISLEWIPREKNRFGIILQRINERAAKKRRNRR